MIRTTQIKLPADHDKDAVRMELIRRAGGEEPVSWQIVRRSLDARKKPKLYYIYTIDAVFSRESLILKKRRKYFEKADRPAYTFPVKWNPVLHGTIGQEDRPVIAGMGPAGLFAGLVLARNGFRPVIFERGESLDMRKKSVDRYFEEGILNPESNIQFGEGGAGTFSDGKLNTMVKDHFGRNRFVLEEFVNHGAPEDILYDAKPHVGTDRLKEVVRQIREEILSYGGEIFYGSKLEGILTDRERLCGIQIRTGEGLRDHACRHLILAIGHSARDTFTMLYDHRIAMEQKAFAIGVRVEHPARMINRVQYGMADPGHVGTATYRLSHQCINQRGVYTFCMCPGGYVVNAASDPKGLCVNGMSYRDRAGINSNSAVVTTVGPEDYESSHPLAGVEFQKKYEELAFLAGWRKVPVQLYGDFREKRTSIGLGDVTPQIKGGWHYSNLWNCLPESVCSSILEGMTAFGRKLTGFDRPDTILCGVETRTSSPVRILRNDLRQSNVEGIFPCGEGAGYAGGITSAAMDGLKTAEALAAGILSRYGS